jgi:cyanophycin synthetase
MEVTRVRALRGPNLWSRHTAMEAIVQCGDEDQHVDAIAAVEAQMRHLFPALGVVRGDPLSLAHILGATALALQEAAGCPVTSSRVASTPERGVFQVVVEYTEEDVGRLAMQLAEAMMQVAILGASGLSAGAGGASFDVDAAVAQLRSHDEDVRLGPSTGSIVDAAVARGIPFRRLTQGSLVQFGWGAKQRRIWAAEVDRTSAVSESIAQDKDLTKRLLRAAGVPVPMGRPVVSVEDAFAAAESIGWPVVVKPQDGNQGKGVTVNITTREGVAAAYAGAEAIGTVMVESYLPGYDFRLLVVGEKLVAAARRDPAHVVGDGKSSVQQLVDRVNTDPRRGDGHATALTKIKLDTIALSQLKSQGMSAASVPTKGQRVMLRNNANLSTGGTATDVTDDVHPEVAAAAIGAARMIGLHVCGVDVVCESVERPLPLQHGGIVEVNAAPGLRMHLTPSYGKGRPVGQAIVDQMYPPGEDGRVPVVAVTGTNGKTTTARLIAHLFKQAGHAVGMTNTDGAYVDGVAIDTGDCSGPRSARNVLMHPDVTAAVFETARGGVLREGLGFDRCKVAVVTNVGLGDHLGLNFITTVEDLAVLKRVIVQNVAADGFAVLNAADPRVAAMAGSCPGRVIYFAHDRNHPVMAAHRAQAQRKVFVERDAIVAAEGNWREIIPLADVPLTHAQPAQGRHLDAAPLPVLPFQVENAMAAVAAAWGAGVPWDAIRKGLATFVSDAAAVPGRFNVMSYRGATVIADYGHNPDAMLALVAAVEAMAPQARRTVVISAAGDRRDQDIREQTQILGAAFDRVVLYQDAAQRGRADGEVLGLLREGLVGARRVKDVVEVRGEFMAIDTALSSLAAGDLCLVLVDQVDEALTHLKQRIQAAEPVSV